MKRRCHALKRCTPAGAFYSACAACLCRSAARSHRQRIPHHAHTRRTRTLHVRFRTVLALPCLHITTFFHTSCIFLPKSMVQVAIPADGSLDIAPALRALRANTWLATPSRNSLPSFTCTTASPFAHTCGALLTPRCVPPLPQRHAGGNCHWQLRTCGTRCPSAHSPAAGVCTLIARSGWTHLSRLALTCRAAATAHICEPALDIACPRCAALNTALACLCT